MNKTIIAVIIIIILGGAGIYLLNRNSSNSQNAGLNQNQATTTASTENKTPNNAESVLGTSIQGRNITAYYYGTGPTELLFVGGIHGGYEWNTALVAYQLMDYLKANVSTIPTNVRVTVIPVLNPDGLNKVVGTTTGNFSKANVSTSQATIVAGRFNGNNVDLNRNFDCDWQSTGVWQNTSVSGGKSVFSEPESQAVKNYVETNKPSAVVVWYSSAGGVYASNCHDGVSSGTNSIMKVYADASGYPANKSFDFYATTGDMTNWLAKSGIPAISVLLTDHTDTEWSKNLAGIKALLQYYSK